MIQYSTFIDNFDSAVAFIIYPKFEEDLEDGPKKRAILANCTSITDISRKIYNILKEAYDNVKEHRMLSFDRELPLPAPSLIFPSYNVVEWIQTTWGIYNAVINVVSNSFPAVRVYREPLKAGISQLIRDLGELYGLPRDVSFKKANDVPKEFPKLKKANEVA